MTLGQLPLNFSSNVLKQGNQNHPSGSFLLLILWTVLVNSCMCCWAVRSKEKFRKTSLYMGEMQLKKTQPSASFLIKLLLRDPLTF